jgi:hypothetical protein
MIERIKQKIAYPSVILISDFPCVSLYCRLTVTLVNSDCEG